MTCEDSGGAGVESRAHTVSIGNIVLGVYVFIVLRLPAEWKLVKGGIPSEFVYSKELEGARWVTEGQAYHYLYNPSNGSQFELTIKCVRGPWRARPPRNLENRTEGTLRLSSHPGTYVWGDLRGGLLRKEQVTYLSLLFRCDRTQRTIRFELRGKGGPEDIRNLTAALGESQCHSV
jgi:hypothetical protein